nr:CHAT domain-containing protein [uncultured Cohaesibacter sp.]
MTRIDRIFVTENSEKKFEIDYFKNDLRISEVSCSPYLPQIDIESNILSELNNYFQNTEHLNSEIEGKIKLIGESLFNSIFGVGLKSRDAYIYSINNPSKIKAEIIFIIKDQFYASLPWELIKDPNKELPLTLTTHYISRRCEHNDFLTPQKLASYLKILFIISRPFGRDDVDFQTVARPLREKLKQKNSNICFKVLRPSTFDELQTELAKATADGEPYHVVHFDGHGLLAPTKEASEAESIFLLFEHENAGSHRIPCDDFARVIKDGSVPMVVLNACNAGSVSTKTEGMNIATKLLQSGVLSVIAMRHSICADSAASYMVEFYSELISGNSVQRAFKSGLTKLYSQLSISQNVKSNVRQDWAIPILYTRGDLNFSTTLTNQDSKTKSPKLDSENIFKHENIIIGRNIEFYKMELSARLNTVILIHGMAGIGKTKLVNYFTNWWIETGGIAEQYKVCKFDFKKNYNGKFTEYFFEKISEKLKIQPSELNSKSLDEKISFFSDAIQSHPLILILENFENLHSLKNGRPQESALPVFTHTQSSVRELIRQLGATTSNSLVIISSRTPESWLGSTGFIRRIKLDSLDDASSSQLERDILKSYPISTTKCSMEYKRLLKWLNGHPMAMESILPLLETMTAENILAHLRGEKLILDSFSFYGGAENLWENVLYSYKHLNTRVQRAFRALTIFDGAVHDETLALMSGSQHFPTSCTRCNIGEWRDVLDQGEFLGLLSQKKSGIYGIHPALHSVIVSEWRMEMSETAFIEDFSSLRLAGVEAHSTQGASIIKRIEELPHISDGVFDLIAPQKETLHEMLIHSLKVRKFKEALNILKPLSSYFLKFKILNEFKLVLHQCHNSTEYPDGAKPDAGTSAHELWSYVESQYALLNSDTTEMKASQHSGIVNYIQHQDYPQTFQIEPPNRELNINSSRFSFTTMQIKFKIPNV